MLQRGLACSIKTNQRVNCGPGPQVWSANYTYAGPQVRILPMPCKQPTVIQCCWYAPITGYKDTSLNTVLPPNCIRNYVKVATEVIYSETLSNVNNQEQQCIFT